MSSLKHLVLVFAFIRLAFIFADGLNGTTTTISPTDSNSSSNDTQYDYYYYDISFDNITENETNSSQIDPNAFGSNLVFSGDNQTRPGLGINVGMITSGMSQWVFTNKFKHADCWRTVSSRDNWATYAFAGYVPTQWDTDGYPVNFTYQGQWGGNLGYITQLGVDGLYPTGDYYL